MMFPPRSPRDVHNCPLANYIMIPSSSFAEVETSLINVNKLMRLCSSIHVQDFMQQKIHSMDTSDTSDHGNAYSIYVDEYLPICKYLFP